MRKQHIELDEFSIESITPIGNHPDGEIQMQDLPLYNFSLTACFAHGKEIFDVSYHDLLNIMETSQFKGGKPDDDGWEKVCVALDLA